VLVEFNIASACFLQSWIAFLIDASVPLSDPVSVSSANQGRRRALRQTGSPSLSLLYSNGGFFTQVPNVP
jgi:hypothetical protein